VTSSMNSGNALRLLHESGVQLLRELCRAQDVTGPWPWSQPPTDCGA